MTFSAPPDDHVLAPGLTSDAEFAHISRPWRSYDASVPAHEVSVQYNMYMYNDPSVWHASVCDYAAQYRAGLRSVQLTEQFAVLLLTFVR